MNKMIPSEIINTDKNGNVAIGKNLEVGGTTKLNGGFEQIKTIRLSPSNFESDLVFNIFIEIPSPTSGIYTFFGSVENNDENSKYICIGEYSNNASQGGLDYIQAYYMYDNGMTINIIKYDATTDTVNNVNISPVTK